MANRILLKGDPLRKEYGAALEVTPGMLLSAESITPGGDINAVIPHPAAGENAYALFALEKALDGGDITDVYDPDERVQCVHARPGDEVLALLANGQNVQRGAFLESAGDGQLRAHTPASAALDFLNAIVAYADEDLDLSGAAGALWLNVGSRS